MLPTNRKEPGSQERAADLQHSVTSDPNHLSEGALREPVECYTYLGIRLISTHPNFPDRRSRTAPMKVCHLEKQTSR